MQHRYVKGKSGTRMASICTPKDRTPTCDALWEVGIVTLIEALFLALLLVICIVASSSKGKSDFVAAYSGTSCLTTEADPGPTNRQQRAD